MGVVWPVYRTGKWECGCGLVHDSREAVAFFIEKADAIKFADTKNCGTLGDVSPNERFKVPNRHHKTVIN